MASTNHSLNKKLYAEMKSQLKTLDDDDKVMRKYGYSKTTVRKIRNTKDWHDYEARTHRFDGYPRKNRPQMNQAPKPGNNGTKRIIPIQSELEISQQIFRNVTLENNELRSRCDDLARRNEYLREKLVDIDNHYNHKTQAIGLIWAVLGMLIGAGIATMIILTMGK